MYYYLVDSKPYDGKNFEYFQTQLLSLVGEYHIGGETARVTKLRTVEDLVATALSHGATTLVIAGGDETFTKAISVAHGKPITLGFIPVSSKSELGGILGIRSLEEAVATIAKRRVENLDLGRVGQSYFISNLYLGWKGFEEEEEGKGQKTEEKQTGWRKMFDYPSIQAELLIDNSFRARDNLVGGSIINARFRANCPRSRNLPLGNPKDGWLDVVLAGKLNKFQAWRFRKELEARCYESLPGGSVIHAKKIEITGEPGLAVFMFDQVIARPPVTVEMTDEKVRMIVGKERQF